MSSQTSQTKHANPLQNQNLATNSKDEVLQNMQHLPRTQEAPSHHTAQAQAQNLVVRTRQSHAQALQARYDTLRDFASKIAKHKEGLSHEAKSLYDSFAKSLESMSPDTLSAK